MGSQCGSDSNDVIQIQTQAQTQTQAHDPLSNPLARQGSLYGLTFDEVQNQLGDLGKPLATMNLDELLKTVWTVEASNQVIGPGPNPSPNPGPDPDPNLTLPIDLSKKTVDEVWQDIQEQQQGQESNLLDRKATLGEMTLEDFLVKAGVVSQSRRNPSLMTQQQQAQWMMNYQAAVFVPGHNHIVDGQSYSESQMMMSSSSPLMGGALSDTQTPGRKRVAPDDIAEKSVERRKKRMIKNRESAARSRARKQAYTHELENKVTRLEEENERLKKQKELEKMLPSIPQPEPKYGLRRTSSAPM